MDTSNWIALGALLLSGLALWLSYRGHRLADKASRRELKFTVERPATLADRGGDDLVFEIHNIGARAETITRLALGDKSQRLEWAANNITIPPGDWALAKIPIGILELEWRGNHQLGPGAYAEVQTASELKLRADVQQDLLLSLMAKAVREARKLTKD